MRSLLAALLLLSAVSAAAGRGPCDSPQTQAEMNRCAQEELHRADSTLNSAYKQLLESLGPDRQRKLRAAERAWLAYRDAHCAYEASGSEGGSIYPLELASCKTEVTRARIAQLRRK